MQRTALSRPPARRCGSSTRASGDERWPGLLLSGLLTQLNSVDWPRGSDADLDAFRAALPTGSWPADPDPLLSSALVDVLAQPVGADRRRQWLHDGRAYLNGLHSKYPRHTSFRKELRSAAAKSPLL